MYWNALFFHRSQLQPLKVVGVRPRKKCVKIHEITRQNVILLLFIAKNNCFQTKIVCFGGNYNVKILTAHSL